MVLSSDDHLLLPKITQLCFAGKGEGIVVTRMWERGVAETNKLRKTEEEEEEGPFRFFQDELQ